MDANGIAPAPSQPVRRRSTRTVRCLGALRIPLAGPYRPRARLYLFPDGRLLWQLRLWEIDRPVAHLVRPEALRAFARRSGLPLLLRSIEAIESRAAAWGEADGA